MNVGQRVEHWLEQRIEGLFRRGASRTVQPIEIGRRMVRTMETERRISVHEVYVPNFYQIMLADQDFASLNAFGTALRAELADHLVGRAHRQGYEVAGDLDVQLVPDPTLAAGQFSVHATFRASDTPPAQPESSGEADVEGAVREDTIIFAAGRRRENKSRERKHESKRTESGEGLAIVAISGPESGRAYPLAPGEHTLGRGEDNAIVVQDPNVSRIHSTLVVNDTTVEIRDAESRNGTFVNGTRVQQAVLREGDEIRVGMTLLSLRRV